MATTKLEASETLELERVPERPMAVQTHDPESILRYALDKNASVETIERLMAVRDKLKAEQSKAAFDAALAAFQSECPIIEKKKFGAKNAYKYAPLDDIIVQVRPLLHKHGFSFSVTAEVEKDWVKACCKVTHREGHSEVSEFKIPIDQRNPMMNDPQRYAGSLTFAKRYSFCNALGILTGDEDNDGGTRPKPPGPATATEKTRVWMISKLRDIEQQSLTYAIDNRLIMPNETLGAWPLSEVPTNPKDLEALRQKILRHQ